MVGSPLAGGMLTGKYDAEGAGTVSTSRPSTAIVWPRH